MLYRLRPPATLEWSDFPGFQTFRLAVDEDVDFDRLDDWQPTTDRMFSADLLRIALRHGVPTPTGIVLEVQHALDLGRSDQLRVGQQAIDELQMELRATSGELMERLIPGWTASGEELDQRVRESTESAAREADEDLAEVLASPVIPELAEHWRRLGGRLPF